MTENAGLPPAQAVAQQIAGQAELGTSTDAGATLEQIQAAQRAAILPYEQQLQAAMATMASMQTQLTQLQAGVSAAQQAGGPPAVEQYANGVATLVKAHADANPDLPAGTFDPVMKTAADIKTWVTAFRAKHLDFSGLLADVELLGGA